MSTGRLSRRELLAVAGGWGAGTVLAMAAKAISAEVPKVKLSTPQAEKIDLRYLRRYRRSS